MLSDRERFESFLCIQVVLRELDWDPTNKMLVLFSHSFGGLHPPAKGDTGRKWFTRNKLFLLTDLLTMSEPFEVFGSVFVPLL